MPAPLKTEAIVLRSIRYGEADRILHLYTPHHGRIARDRQGGPPGAQPVRSPARAVLPRARRCCTRGAATCTRSPASTRSRAHAALRDHAATLDAAARACDAVARLFETADPHPEVFACSPTSSRCCAPIRLTPVPANGLAFRLKLLLAAGILPQLGACAACGEPEHLHGFSAAAGGVVCGSCEAAAFPLDEEAYRFLVGRRRPAAGAGAGGLRARAAPGRARDHRDRRAPRPRAAAPAARRPLDDAVRTSTDASPRRGAVRIGV